jgi:hypothetical protein
MSKKPFTSILRIGVGSTFLRNVFLTISFQTLKTEAVCSPETLVLSTKLKGVTCRKTAILIVISSGIHASQDNDIIGSVSRRFLFEISQHPVAMTVLRCGVIGDPHTEIILEHRIN